MDLRQAFTMWANDPKNIVLAGKSREAVQRVLMKKYSDVDIEQFTPELVRKVFQRSTECPEFKSKAASVLVYILQWGAERGHCNPPTFDYTIASERDAQKRGKSPIPVAQIDPHTLNVVRIWPSISEAAKMTVTCNIDRAIERKRLAGGYFWCLPEDAEGFRPNPKAGRNLKADPAEQCPEDAGESCDARQVAAAEAIQEDAEPVVATEAAAAGLSGFTDEELWHELERRGWEGELSRRQVVRLGIRKMNRI